MGRTDPGLLLAGVGGFNLFDGVVDHKLLRLHQVRQDIPDLLPNDTGWITVSLLLVARVAVARRRDRSRSGR